MKRILLCIAAAMLTASSLRAQCKLDYSNYQLVFEENFDHISSVADLSPRWAFQHIGDPGYGWGDWTDSAGTVHHGEYYDPGQVELNKIGQNGILRLKAEYQSPRVSVYSDWIVPGGGYRNCNYKSGMIQLRKDLSGLDGFPPNDAGFKYGMFEIRMKIPQHRDAFPAFWLIGPTQFNVFEGKPSNNDRMYAVGYTNMWETGRPEESILVEKPDMGALGDDFHTYTGVWTPDQITYFYDGRELCTFRNPTVAQLQSWGFWSQANSIIVSMQMPGWISDDRLLECHMDIDYVKVYKPIGGNYSLPYKSTNEYMLKDIQKDDRFAGNVSPFPNSITINPNDENEIFYRGDDNWIYVAHRVAGVWDVTQLLFNDGPPSLAAGEIRYLQGHDKIIYVGANGKINVFGRSATEPCGFYHWYLRSDWWIGTYDNIAAEPGALQVTPDGNDIFYKGADAKMHRYHWDGSDWNHSVLVHPPGTEVKGDIVIDPAIRSVFYKAVDNRLKNFWITGTGDYHFDHIDVSSTDYKVLEKAGSMVWASNAGGRHGVLYIGTDNKIQFYSWSGSAWEHDWLPYIYYYPGASGDYAFGSITWDNVQQRLYYGAFDGRIQGFRKTSTGWDHILVNDYWGSNEYNSFQSSLPPLMTPFVASSVIVGAEATSKSIYFNAYSKRCNSCTYIPHPVYFKYEPCEVLNLTTGTYRNLNKIAPHNGENTGILNSTSVYRVFPNPASSILTVACDQMPEEQNISIADVTGRVVKKQNASQKSTEINISELPKGLYMVTVDADGRKYNFKVVKN